MNDDLPIGWTSFALKDIGGVSGGKTPSKANSEFWSSPDIPWVSPKDMKRNLLEASEDKISQKAVVEAGMTLYPAGAVLMVTRSGILQHTFPVALAGVELTVNQDIKVLRPIDGIDPKFVFYLIKSFGEKILSACSKDGTTVQSIDSEKLETFQFPLPPAAEQSRIVQKLDELLAQVNTLKARIAAIPTLLKRFRRSVLAAAISGRLTEAWHERSSPFPKKQIGELFDITSGPAFKKKHYSNEGSRLLQIANIGYGSTLWETANYIPTSLAKLEERFDLRTEDIVMALNRPITNGSLKTAKIEIQDLPATLYQRVARFRKIEEESLNIDYIFLCFQTYEFKIQVQRELQGSDQPYINTSSLKGLEIYFPQLDVQTEIVRHVDQLFAFADQLEAKVASAKKRIDHLPQSILAKAFRGELVPQDPSDEPASVLLERIKAQRTTAPKVKRGRKALA
jgi:type I restriction enzyme S subunit